MRQVINTTLKEATLGGSVSIEGDGSQSYGVGQRLADYLSPLPEDEQVLIQVAAFLPIQIGAELESIIDFEDELLKNTNSQGSAPAKLRQYREYLQFIAKLRSLPQGFTITVDDPENNKSVALEPRLHIFPLVLNHPEQQAFFPTMIGILRVGDQESTPLSASIKSQVLEKLEIEVETRLDETVQHYKATVSSLLADAHEEFEARFVEIKDEFEASIQESVENSDDYEIPALDDSIPQHRPMIGEVWKFIVKLVEEKLEVEEIAAWLEEWTVKVE
jgi:hypothetical protein